MIIIYRCRSEEEKKKNYLWSKNKNLNRLRIHFFLNHPVLRLQTTLYKHFMFLDIVNFSTFPIPLHTILGQFCFLKFLHIAFVLFQLTFSRIFYLALYFLLSGTLFLELFFFSNCIQVTLWMHLSTTDRIVF